MAETDWVRIAIDTAIGIGSGVVGVVGGAFQFGRRSVKREQKVKEDYDSKIRALGEEMRSAMVAHAQKSEDGNDLLVSQFHEAFAGIRRQFDEHRLATEKDFLRKDDFRDFREEYREDMRELKSLIERK